MHECFECGQACDCDIEDTWFDEAPDDCSHDCDDEEFYDDGYDDFDDC